MTQKVRIRSKKVILLFIQHAGVGRILGTEKREVAGMTLVFGCRFEHDRMTLRVPWKRPAASASEPKL